MNGDLTSYIENIISLRGTFAKISKVYKQSEAMKIWARWIITHRSLCSQTNLILPDDEVFDPQLIIELQEKGCNYKHALYLQEFLVNECRKINKKYCATATVEDGGVHGNIVINTTLNGRNITLECNNHIETLPISVYNKMGRNYRYLPYAKNNYIWLCACIYGILGCKGLQWAVPSRVLDLLQETLGCNTELFASPINNYFSNYYSLFDGDKAFGSKGNFFTAPNSDFIEGCYQINPPFIDPIFTKTTEKVLFLLSEAENNNKKLTFVYIMPEWKDFITYNMVSESRFCVKTITLKSNHHRYYQYCTSSYIPARFNSYIIFLSTDTKICSNSLEHNIRYSFSGNNY